MWRRLSTPQCPKIQAVTVSGRASAMCREQSRVDHINVLPALDNADASSLEHLSNFGEVRPGKSLDGLDGEPHPPTVTVGGQAISAEQRQTDEISLPP